MVPFIFSNKLQVTSPSYHRVSPKIGLTKVELFIMPTLPDYQEDARYGCATLPDKGYWHDFPHS